ncbi:single-stranded DNA-binding protein [Methylocella sp.]|uniref:single-stranded DNA-binding protein n=1 Tax=Methylocella sp. TaxID=1978226 RepID=UPI003783C556
MSLVLLTGTVFRLAEIKTSRAGKPYARLTVKERNGESATFWGVTLFSESAIAEIDRLRKDDGVSVRGRLEATLYTPEGGEPRVSLSVIADAVLPLKPKKRAVSTSAARDTLGRSWHPPAGPDDLSDTIPF